uniref:THIF-type NAD/FAD binding fold domain-containing protein n=1 Tax=Pinguiococcus pyrenoidosus TaxID=172671 RepID=A0A7R9YEF0_9STRA|mmetsp:Transcript_6796/g.26259  ORF Transcript_6796/g.26259 Transcript_6796/m.26259 type:complete len:193 (+) Transcript_6796:562-1140(+)
MLGLEQFDCVLDAVDSRNDKIDIIRFCVAAGVPLIVAGAAGDRADPTKIRVGDITEVRGDSLLKQVRKALRQQHGFPRADGSVAQKGKGPQLAASAGRRKRSVATPWGLPCVYSLEQTREQQKSCAVQREDALGLSASCDATFGTACFTVGSFGFVAASAVIEEIVAPKALGDRRKGKLPVGLGSGSATETE